jgi:hypothetical protein
MPLGKKTHTQPAATAAERFKNPGQEERVNRSQPSRWTRGLLKQAAKSLPLRQRRGNTSHLVLKGDDGQRFSRNQTCFVKQKRQPQTKGDPEDNPWRRSD